MNSPTTSSPVVVEDKENVFHEKKHKSSKKHGTPSTEASIKKKALLSNTSLQQLAKMFSKSKNRQPTRNETPKAEKPEIVIPSSPIASSTTQETETLSPTSAPLSPTRRGSSYIGTPRNRARPLSTIYDLKEVEDLLGEGKESIGRHAAKQFASAAHSSARLVRTFSQKVKKGMGSVSNLNGLLEGFDGDEAVLLEALETMKNATLKRKRSESVSESSGSTLSVAEAALMAVLGKRGSVSIRSSSRQKKQKAQDIFNQPQEKNKVFGVAVTTLMPEADSAIPSFLLAMMGFIEEHGLEVEGIFRLSASMMELIKLKDSINSGSFQQFDIDTDKHVVACLLKAWLRELPGSLIPDSLYSQLYETFGGEDGDEDNETTIKNIAGILQEHLPAQNKTVLQALSFMASKIAAHSDVNKMTSTNLGIVLGPNLLWRSDHSESLSFVNKIAKMLIDYPERIFGPQTTDIATQLSQSKANFVDRSDEANVDVDETIQDEDKLEGGDDE